MPTNIDQGTDTIVLIHGLWMTALSWEHWVERYRGQGYRVIAESWPGMDGDIADVRADTSNYDDIGVTEVADHYAALIEGLETPPVIMGHSFGGLITQLLLDRGLGHAGVAIDSAPIKGVLALPVSTLRTGFPALKNPKNDHRAVTLTPDEFHYAFTNTLTDAESLAVYERYAVPGPGRPLFQAAFANFNPHAATRVDFHNDSRAPLLIIAGGEDHVSPVAINKSEAKHQGKSTSITAYREFPGRTHFTLGQAGWEEVADFALAWSQHPVPTAA
jgi:alpha-beta hydrolase superfamily lysophospholipase